MNTSVSVHVYQSMNSANKTVTAGTRVRHQGDMSNAPKRGTVKAVDGGWMFVVWDGTEKALPMPVALLGLTMSTVSA